MLGRDSGKTIENEAEAVQFYSAVVRCRPEGCQRMEKRIGARDGFLGRAGIQECVLRRLVLSFLEALCVFDMEYGSVREFP